MIEEIRKSVKADIIDFQQLELILHNYKKPRDKIKRLVDDGQLIRLKNGLFLFSEIYRKEPICLPYIANILYGPSYVSLQYALYWYGLIPEKVVEVTSVSVDRTKRFETNIGRFSYVQLGFEKYSPGIEIVHGSTPFLMARPDKALADLVMRTPGLKSVEEMKEYLEEDLRFDTPSHFKLSEEVIQAYQGKKIQFLREAFL